MTASPNAICLLVLIVGCEQEAEDEIPPAPDLSELIAEYQSPTAVFSDQVASEIVDSVNVKLGLSRDLDNLEFVTSGAIQPTIDEAEGEPEGGEGEEDKPLPFGLNGKGFARIRHICRGDTPDAAPDVERNGALDLVMTFSETGIDPVVFGAATACRTVINDAEVLIDGGVQFDHVERLFNLSVRVEVDGVEILDGGFDFRVPLPNIEFRIRLVDGTHLVFFIDTDRTSVGFRAANGDWDCSLTDLQCSDGAGNTVSIAGLEL